MSGVYGVVRPADMSQDDVEITVFYSDAKGWEIIYFFYLFIK